MLSLLKGEFFQNFSNYPLIKLLQNIEEMVLKLQMLIRFLKAHLLNKQVEIKILNHKKPLQINNSQGFCGETGSIFEGR